MAKKNLSFISAFLLSIIVLFSAWGLQQEQKGYTVTKPAPDTDGKTSILLYYDMDGISGIDNWRQVIASFPEYYQKGRELLTEDVNAVIAGLYEGGADEIHVIDGHGSGNNAEPDIILSKMDSRAEFIQKSLQTDVRIYKDFTREGIYDAVVIVGMHTRTGGGGFLSHRYTLGMDWIMNDMSLNEADIIALSWGRVNVPVIFVSGDDKLKDELSDKPWIEYVTVKLSKSVSSAKLKPVDEVHVDLRKSAKRAVGNISTAQAVSLNLPINVSLRAELPASLKILDGTPGVEYRDNSVHFSANNFDEAFDGIINLIEIAQTAYSDQIFRAIGRQGNAQKIVQDYITNLFNVSFISGNKAKK